MNALATREVYTIIAASREKPSFRYCVLLQVQFLNIADFSLVIEIVRVAAQLERLHSHLGKRAEIVGKCLKSVACVNPSFLSGQMISFVIGCTSTQLQIIVTENLSELACFKPFITPVTDHPGRGFFQHNAFVDLTSQKLQLRPALHSCSRNHKWALWVLSKQRIG